MPGQLNRPETIEVGSRYGLSQELVRCASACANKRPPDVLAAFCYLLKLTQKVTFRVNSATRGAPNPYTPVPTPTLTFCVPA